MKDVFISYKAEELEEASWVRSVLESNGISCWMAPKSIPGGSSYAAEIPQAIRGAKVFVLILSERSQGSQWVSRELDTALNQGKVVMPFMLENCALRDDFNFYLTNVQRYAAYENKAAAMEKMVREIRALLGEPAEAPVAPNPVAASAPRAVPAAKTDLCSILSMVTGLIAMIAMFGLFVVPNLLACTLAVIGVRNIRRKNTAGMGFAIAGLALGIIANFCGWIGVLALPGGIVAAVINAVFAVMFVLFARKK